jgi:phage terminase large subunit GpA-like protein
MHVTFDPASSESVLAQRPVRYLVLDEVSRFPSEVRGRSREGDPLMLSKARLSTFGDLAKTIYCSSPVERDACRISALYEASTREKYHSCCPLCGNLQILKLSEMDFESVTCRCLKCGQGHTQDGWQSQPGSWIAENPKCSRRVFWTNCFPSPFIRWPVVFAEFREAVHRKEEGDASLFRAVLSTRLCENFVEKVVKMSEPEILMSRREQYPFEVPNEAKAIVCAIDTQKHWLEFAVAAAGPRGELWFLQTGTVDGNIESDGKEMYEEFDRRVLGKQWLRPDKRAMKITRGLQDSGGCSTSAVYFYCRKYARQLTAYKGSHEGPPWRRATDQTQHVRLIMGNANLLKDRLANQLAVEVCGPGYIHFPLNPAAGFDQEFFEQLLSEKKERRRRQGVFVTS